MADQRAQSEELDNELLTAYLDGELSDSDCIAVEKRLAEDKVFHLKMRELQSAWEMLDSLPLAKPGGQFVNTTVEMAIGGHRKKSSWGGNFFMGLLALLILASMFGLSYFLTRESIEQPERELVYNLPLIENHDRYTKVVFDDGAESGIKFLKSIYSKGLFREVDDLFQVDMRDDSLDDFDGTAQPPDAQRIKDRTDRLARMTEQQRSELFEKKKKFEQLPEKQRETLREFHELLSQELDREELVEVLASYYDWLKILGMSQRANLLDLPRDERLREIGRITRRQAQENFGTTGSFKLPDNDAVAFYEWYDISIHFYNHEIRQRTGELFSALQRSRGIPTTEVVVDRIKKGPIEQLVEFLMRNDRKNFGKLLCADLPRGDIGLGLLRTLVSDQARSLIDQSGFTPREQRELILKWIEGANRSRFAIKTEVLRSFYDELGPEQRDELDNQHPNMWHESLARMYWEANIGRRSTPSAEEEFEEFLRQNGFSEEFIFWEDEP